jgi:septal ring factor EnvC (AmiA/AmiB activator)
MRAAGFVGFERGERGSTAEHLEVLDYKIKQDTMRTAELEKTIADKQKASANLSATIQKQESIAAENKKQLADQEKKIKTMQGKLLTVKQIEKIPVKVSRPFIGGAENDAATIPNKDWESVKKTALTQAQKHDEYTAAMTENAMLKKEKSKWRKEKQGLEEKLSVLEHSTQEKFLERATRNAELHNLKNDVAKIPKDVWEMYTNPRAKQRNSQRGDAW